MTTAASTTDRSARHSSASNEHYTPLFLVEASRHALGGFDLDPASNERVNRERVKAGAFYSQKGLVEPWFGRVFLNPPGGRVDKLTREPVAAGGTSSQLVWFERLTSLWRAGVVESAIFIGFSVELLQTSQSLLVPATRLPFCVPRRRVPFDTLAPVKRATPANLVDVLADDDAETEYEFVSGKSPTHSNVIVFFPKVARDVDRLVVHASGRPRWLYDAKDLHTGSIASFLAAFKDVGEAVLP